MRTHSAAVQRIPGRRLFAASLAGTIVVLICAGAVVSLVAVLDADRIEEGQAVPWPRTTADPSVTPVGGASWLNLLGVTPDRTNLGRGAQQYGPPADQKTERGQEALGVRPSQLLTGADLYRFNCQACHREEGGGAPPEIRSVLGPVQGSSLELVRKQLRQQTGSEATARARANKARADILTRIRNGGQQMPARDYLRDADLQSLFAYLTQLAASPDRERPTRQAVSWARLGEQVVKGTCHICHDAVGPRPSPAALLRGAIPSLESLLATKQVNEFVHKARSGAPIVMGDLPLPHRGRMPVFHYLRDEEVAAAYMYLATYPPQAAAGR